MRGTSTIALLGTATLSLVAASPLLLSSSACATELPSLQTCSAVEPLKDCNAIELAGTDARRVQLSLTAKRAVVPIGPYMVDTETLNETYLPPLLMLTPGQDFELKLTNKLETLPAPLFLFVATINP
jgi:hypothetical protein